ncbi:MAG: FAD-dependent oxidoreductase, partial [Deltaproteobacteria bacterium]|nr:FAD-dependent oxidoreductase [Deltaproteobacteria bacterium]
MSIKISILGAGPGGYVAAVRAAQLGAEVTLIEKDTLGGTCLNRGCIPSKIMQTTAQMLHQFSRCDEFGISLEGSPVVDMAKLMARKEKIVKTQVRGIEGLLKHNGVTHIKGQGTIKCAGVLAVLSAEGDTREIEWEKLILSVGSEPLEIPAFPFDGEKVISSTHVLSLETIPESMVIVGGGVI